MVSAHALGLLPLRLASIPSPPVSGFHLGPLFVHFYGLMYVVAISLAIYITARRWAAAGGDGALVYDVALWGVPAGIIGGRIYFDITTPFDITPHTWWGTLAVWKGGLGIWGGVAPGCGSRRVAGAARRHRRIQPQGLLALYVAGYSGYRIFEETIRIDSSAHFLGLRLDFFIAIVMTAIGLAWFAVAQRRGAAAAAPAATSPDRRRHPTSSAHPAVTEDSAR